MNETEMIECREPALQMQRLIAIMKRLRAPQGCPWDAEQTHHSDVYKRQAPHTPLQAPREEIEKMLPSYRGKSPHAIASKRLEKQKQLGICLLYTSIPFPIKTCSSANLPASAIT